MTKVILIRHGESVWNKEMKYQGHADIALTDTGLWQAERLAARLAREQLTAVYASDLSRAFVTAEIVAAGHNMTVQSVPALREISFGEWEGLTYHSINEKWPDIMSNLYVCPDEVDIPGGETFRSLKDRAGQAIAELVRAHKDETIAVISHGGTIRTILCDVLHIHLNHVWNIRQDNTAMNIIEYYDHRTMVSLVNDTGHLRDGWT